MQAISDIEFGKAAVTSGVLKASQLALCMKLQNEMRATQEKKKSLPDILVEKGYLTPSQVRQITDKLSGHPGPALAGEKKGESSSPSLEKDGKQEEIFGRYTLTSELGKGGMGCVYKAYDSKLDRGVALKRLLGEGSENERERFAREARAMGQLHHPNIVSVYDIGEVSGRPYFTMELIEGPSLQSLVKDGKLTIRQTVGIMIKVCEGIAYSHSQGIIHRDLKPSNVMVTHEMEPKIMDFGLAKLSKESKKLSQSGMMLGTLHYMPPEQAEGKIREIDNRSDVYSLGVMLYEALTGRMPFTGNTLKDLLQQISSKEPVPPSRIKPTISNNLDTIVLKALEKKKERRYAGASAMGEDLLRFHRGEAPCAKPPGMAERVWRKVKSNRAMTIALISCLIGLISMLAVVNVWNDWKRRGEFENCKVQIEQAMGKISSTSHHISQKTAGEDAGGLKGSLRQEIEERIQQNMEVHTRLDQANALFPQNLWIKRNLSATEREIGMLALLVRNYALSQVFFKRYRKSSADPGEAEKLLKKVEEKRSEVEKAQVQRIEEIMGELDKAPPVQGMVNEYVTEIIKMSGEHVVRKLLPFLDSKNDWQRRIAIESLGKLGDVQAKFQGKDSVEWLVEKLKAVDLSKRQDEAEEIVWALGRLRDERAEKAVNAIRWKGGPSSIFWKNTIIPYRWIPLSEKTADKWDAVEGKSLEEAESYNRRALARQNKGDLDGAIADFTRAIQICPGSARTYYNRGFAYRLRGDLENAISDFTHSIRIEPGFSGAYVNRGVAHQEKKELEHAMADYTKAIQLDPSSIQSYNNRGNVRKAKRDIEGAISDYTQAIQLDPKCAEAYNNRGTMFMAQKKLESAIADYTSAIALNPRMVEMYFNRGNALLQKGDLEKALMDCTHAVQLDPRSFSAYFNRGNVRLMKGDAQGAILDYDQAIQLNPMGLEAYNNRATARSKKGDIEGAVSDYTHILQVNPNYFSAYINRAKIYSQRGEKKKAVDDVKAALHLSPNHPNVPEWKAFIQKYDKNR